LLDCARLEFSSIARLVAHKSRSAPLSQPIEAFMSAPQNGAPLRDGTHYREMADRLRELARQCRLPGARRELLDLAASFDRRAEHFESTPGAPPRQSPPANLDPSAG
jgi:hypothetical protein